MAQAFVIRNDLAAETAQTPVRVFATYPNSTVVAIDAHGAQCTLLTVAENLIVPDRTGGPSTLAANWRDNYLPIVNGEAARRINIAFPEYKQRNYNAQYQIYITDYGSDTASWPTEAKDFKVEYDRGWQYVNDVRTLANSWTALPTDPTADAIWPPAITPIK